MAKPYRLRVVSSVNRAYSCDPLERVNSIGGVNPDHTAWSLSQAAAIALIERGTDEFFFRIGDQTIKLRVLTCDGEKYLQSERESTHPDDLLNLPSAPSASARSTDSPSRRRSIRFGHRLRRTSAESERVR